MKIWSVLLLAVPSFAQISNLPGTEAFDAYEKGARIRMAREAQQLERERFEYERALQQQRIQLEHERLELERERAKQAKTTSERDRDAFTAELDKAFSALNQVHPDLHQHMDEMNRITALLIPAPNGGMSVKDYIEALYVVAKHASFTQSNSKAPAPTSSAPAAQRDPLPFVLLPVPK
jgi:hypothetical protein